MRHYIQKQIPAREDKILDKTTCDLCGKIAKSGDWESSAWEINEKDKLIPWLESQGCKAKREDWDW